MDQIDSLLEGSVDMHIHSGPGLISRSLDHVEACLLYTSKGVRLADLVTIMDQLFT